MTEIVSAGSPEPDQRDGGHRPSVAKAWTDEQTVYALFLNNACIRLEVIAVKIGIKPYLVGVFVRDARVTIYHARHTHARGWHGEVWIEAIAHHLGRKRRYAAAMHGRRSTIFWSLFSIRSRSLASAICEAQRPTYCGSAVGDDVVTVGREVGYSDAGIVEIVANIATNFFT